MRPHVTLSLLAALLIFVSFSSAAITDPYEANIQGVDYLRQGDDVIFWVTIYDENDGSGESYAAWWQVETRNGTLLGRKTLSETTETTIQSEATFPVPEGIRYITVRGYDNTRGYGGQIVELDIIGENQGSAEGEDDDSSTGSGSDGGSGDAEETGDDGGLDGQRDETADTNDGTGEDATTDEEPAGPADILDGTISLDAVFNALTGPVEPESREGARLFWIGVMVFAVLIALAGHHRYA